MTSPADLPTGTVTFLFTDIEGSTRLIEALDEAAPAAFAQQAGIMREAINRHGGIELGTEGDSFFCVFAAAVDAVAAAVDAQRALTGADWPADHAVTVRMGLHTGEGTLGGDNYFGIDVHRASRVAASAHGGQVVLSAAAHGLVDGNLPDGVSLRDLGLHRLRDLSQPEHLFDLVIDGLPSEFPPLRAIAAGSGGLPEPVASFVGRDREVADVVALFDTERLVTCTGPGGVGKTRLVVAAADALRTRFDAVFFVELAPVTDPALVAPAILRALGFPPTAESAEDHLPAVLATNRWLLVLDNFEHVVQASGVVATILRTAPEVGVLVTSRTPLRIAGEQEYPLTPLRVPGFGDDGTPTEAEQLFIERARAVRPDLVVDGDTRAAIADITRRLEGIPLAIELAAARVRVLPPVALRQRMGRLLDVLQSPARDLDDRQRTLRGAIEWSYNLLDEGQQRLLEDFSVFRGGATMDSIEGVCDISRDYWQWLEDLDALVAHSLVRRIDNEAESRFEVLEMIREFAAEKLAERGLADEIAGHHLAWFLSLAERAAADITGPDQRTWLTTLDQERDNLQGALTFAMDHGDGEGTSRMLLALWRYWHMRGPIPEGLAQAEKALALEHLGRRQRLRILEAAGGLAWWAGDITSAEIRYRDALAIAREIGDEAELANALYNAGTAAGFQGEAAGFALLEEGLTLAERTGNVLAAAQCHWGLSTTHQFRHDFERGYAELWPALDGFRAAGDRFMEHWTLRELGLVETELGLLDDAAAHIRHALDYFSANGDLSGTLLLLRDHARLAALRGDMGRAFRLVGAATAHESASGLVLGQFELEAIGIESPLVATDEAEADRRRAEGATWSLDEAVAYALAAR